LPVIGAEFWGERHVDNFLRGVKEEMDALLQRGLWEKGWVVLVVWFALCLSHVVAEGGTRARHQEGDHALAEEALGISHVEEFAVLALGEDTEVDGGYVLIPGVDDGGTVLHELEHGEFLEGFLAKLVLDLFFGPLAFLLDVETAKIDVVLCLPSSETGKTNFSFSKDSEGHWQRLDLPNLGGWWWR
jgi:hypothetical protein